MSQKQFAAVLGFAFVLTWITLGFAIGMSSAFVLTVVLGGRWGAVGMLTGFSLGLALLLSLADHAGTAIHNASLYADVRRHREQLQAIIDHSPAAISLRDGRGQYLLTNRRWEQLGWEHSSLGYPTAPATGFPEGGAGGGVIQATASEATLSSILAARWRATAGEVNRTGGAATAKLVAYALGVSPATVSAPTSIAPRARRRACGSWRRASTTSGPTIRGSIAFVASSRTRETWWSRRSCARSPPRPSGRACAPSWR